MLKLTSSNSLKPIYSMLINIIITFFIFYVFIVLFVYLFQSYLLYFPIKQISFTPKTALNLEYEDVFFETADQVKIHGWFIPCKKSKGVILFCHGNAGNISHRLESIAIFHDMGMSIFIFDYRGYGLSDGNTSEKGTYLDAEAAWDYLCNIQNIDPGNIIIFGRSLGSSVSAWLAKEKSPAAVILESSFTSVTELGSKLYPFLPVRLISRFKYNTSQYVQQISCKKLFIHSKDDEIMPFSSGERNFKLAKKPKQFLTIHGSHNEGFMQSIHIYKEGLENFINDVIKN